MTFETPAKPIVEAPKPPTCRVCGKDVQKGPDTTGSGVYLSHIECVALTQTTTARRLQGKMRRAKESA